MDCMIKKVFLEGIKYGVLFMIGFLLLEGLFMFGGFIGFC